MKGDFKMKNYDNSDNFREKVHTVRVTFQSGKYKGHIAFKMGGNCRGKDLLDWDADYEEQENVEKYVENDCQFRIDDEGNIYCMVLKDDEGNELEIECYDSREVDENIVAIEIIDCLVKR